MKTTLRSLLIATALALPVSAWAGHHEHGEGKMEQMQMCEPGQECQMADKMSDMQKQMGGMMERMHKMMDMPCDKSMKKDMGDMMRHMQEMHGHMGKMMGMMGGKGMMHGNDDEDENHDEHKH